MNTTGFFGAIISKKEITSSIFFLPLYGYHVDVHHDEKIP